MCYYFIKYMVFKLSYWIVMDRVFVVFASAIYGVQGTLWFANYYTNHMVLQKGPQRSILWGYGDVIEETVAVFLDGVLVEETIVTNDTTYDDGFGIWKLKLPPENDPGPHEIRVNSSDDEIVLYDVLFGEVWLCSGQSNMEFPMRKVYDSDHEINDSLKYSNIRMLSTEETESYFPEDDVVVSHDWTPPVRGIIDNFSAVCFMFARDLQKHLNYPIGLIESSVGGTPIEAWSSTSAIESCLSKTKHRRWREPSLFWNAMIHPYTSMTIKGVLWYQGEGNVMNAKAYSCKFPALIYDWRKQFHRRSDEETDDNLPFGFVQLAPNRYGDRVGGFPRLRWSQTTGIGYVPNTDLPNTFKAVAIDLPDFTSPFGVIHPRHKQDIAARLVLGARNLVYGESDVIYQGPFPTGYGLNLQVQTMSITFNNDTGNLRVNNKNGFEICCVKTRAECNKQQSWITADIIRFRHASVEIDIFRCSMENIAGVRYLWRESPCEFKKCALYDNSTNLPVPPFRMFFFEL